ncbi:MAG: glycoside hydrolase family 5 protein [Hydrogenophilus sp.]|nr:glycoside hydrolase family 5 protein [Hydrogenophilus sp.]
MATIRGVNLGSWLVLEKWMVPSLFEGLAATDETSWCVMLGRAEATRRLREHWRRWIGREDFAWLAERGINAVRLPVGHWVMGPPYPYHPRYGTEEFPFVEGGIEVVDQALRWAEEFGLQVLLDLHAAPGCQNGFDNGGMLDVCEWHTRKEYIDFSVELLGRLAERYRSEQALWGIEVLNEPRWDVPTAVLKDYYERAYHAIRAHLGKERVVMFHDGFRDWREYVGFMQPPAFEGVWFDVHRYQCFTREDLDSDIFEHLRKTVVDLRAEADAIRSELQLPTVCGEWSLGLDLKVVSLWAEGPFNHPLELLDGFQQEAALRGFAAAQLLAFERYDGWFFWNYKTETTPAWCFREAVARGWLPASFDARRYRPLR